MQKVSVQQPYIFLKDLRSEKRVEMRIPGDLSGPRINIAFDELRGKLVYHI